MNDLAALGWTDELEAAMTTHAERGFEPARVVAEHRGGYYVRSAIGDLRSDIANRQIADLAARPLQCRPCASRSQGLCLRRSRIAS